MTADVLLSCRDIRVSFGGVIALDGVSIDAGDQECLGVAGPNGAGKTTLFNAISGFADLASGSVRFDGEWIGGEAAHNIARRGLLRTFQTPALIDTHSVEANVVLGAQFARKGSFLATMVYGDDIEPRVMDALETFHLQEVRHRQAASISLLQKKRVMMASAYAAGAKMILLDEPAGGLTDAECEDLIRDIAELRRKKLSVMIIEHVMPVLMSVSDRVVVMNQGSVIFEGSPTAMQRDPGVRNLYFGETP